MTLPSSGDAAAALPPPVVPADVYVEDYYRSTCAGHEAWSASGGAAADGMYDGFLDRAGLGQGQVLVDLGCGRGELLAAAVARGADRAVGVEYSPDAVRLARQTLERRDAQERAEVVQGDLRAVPLPDGVADVVTMLDVVEHLSPAELDAALAETKRLLRPGGRLLVHTMPNRAVYDVTYRVLRAVWRVAGRRWPADPRNEWEHLMHVNEQTVGSLKGAMRRAGLHDVDVQVGRWVHVDFVPSPRARRALTRLATVPGVRRVVAADVWGEARG